MKTILVALAAALLALPAHAAEGRLAGAPLQQAQSLYTCSASGLSRVSFTPAPAPCCSGQLGCPQLLSNTGLVKAKRDNRT